MTSFFSFPSVPQVAAENIEKSNITRTIRRDSFVLSSR